MESNEEPTPENLIAKDQGTNANPWPHPRPDTMTDVHELLLKEFWKEGLTPTGLIAELASACSLSFTEARKIVMHWMWKAGGVVQ